MIKYTLAALAAAATFSTAQAATLDFDTVGNCAGGPGVTFTILSSSSCSVRNTPNGTNGLSLLSPTTQQVRADFTDTVSFVSVDLGDFGADNDTVFIRAFDSANVLLGSQFRNNLGARLGTVSVAAANISYAIFGTTIDAGFISADNFTFTPETPAVPLPAGGALLLTGLAALAIGRRRKS